MVQSRTNSRILSRNIIKSLGLAGAITAAIAAPNSTSLLDIIMKHKDKKRAKETLRKLKYRQIIEITVKNGELHYKLTRKGFNRFQKIIIDELKINAPRRWDQKWRAVMFDIPVTHNKQRKYFLSTLRQLNFYKLQDSIWVHPFECEKEIGVITSYYGLASFVSYVLIEKGNFTDHAIKVYKEADILM